MTRPLHLPAALSHRLDEAYTQMLQPTGARPVDFTRPPGEPALVPASSLSWRIFKNPVSLFIGGVTAVLLELAEPGVRTGVWEHSSFRRDPVTRLQRTGLAAMVTVYGARSVAEAMIAGVNRMHAKVAGQTPHGEAYRASDTDLLDWVQATATYGFATAYSAYVRHLNTQEMDNLYADAQASAVLYGATGAPATTAAWEAMLDAMQPRLEPSPIVFEFLAIMRHAPAFPAALRPLQHLLIAAAIDIVPEWVRQRIGLTPGHGLASWQRPLVQQAARLADRLVITASPAVQACRRLGLADDYLYR